MSFVSEEIEKYTTIHSESESELEKYKKKQSIKAKILEINQEQSIIRCGIRELEEDPFLLIHDWDFSLLMNLSFFQDAGILQGPPF